MRTILSNDEGRVVAVKGSFGYIPETTVVSGFALALISSQNKMQAIVIPKGAKVCVEEGDRVKNGTVIAQWQ